MTSIMYIWQSSDERVVQEQCVLCVAAADDPAAQELVAALAGAALQARAPLRRQR